MRVKTFIFNPIQVNTYLVVDECSNQCMVIDAGCLFDDEKKIIKDYINNNNLILTRVINTHLHLDHIFGNTFFAQEFGVKPEAHAADEDFIRTMPAYAQTFGINVTDKAQELGGYLKEGDTIKLGCVKFEIFEIPGHSQGGLAFYSKENNVVFVGDSLFAGSIGRTDLPGGNYNDLIKNIKTKLLTLPEETKVFCGHGPTTTIALEKTSNPYLI